SYGMMQKAADRLRPWCAREGYTLLSQSDGVPRTQMVERFRTATKAVLFGVDSFWQGVDVPGEALSNVVITKLPFAVPDRPVLAGCGSSCRAASSRGASCTAEVTKRNSGGSRRSNCTATPARQAHTPAGDVSAISYGTPHSIRSRPNRGAAGSPASAAGTNSK